MIRDSPAIVMFAIIERGLRILLSLTTDIYTTAFYPNYYYATTSSITTTTDDSLRITHAPELTLSTFVDSIVKFKTYVNKNKHTQPDVFFENHHHFLGHCWPG